MLITCPKCSVQYKVPDEITLKQGQKVQCSACGHIFEFMPMSVEDTPKKQNLLPPEDAVLSIHSKTESIVVQTTTPADMPVKKKILPEVFRPVQGTETVSRLGWDKVIVSIILLICLVGIGWLWRDLLFLDVPFEKVFKTQGKDVFPVTVPSHKKTSKKKHVSLVPKPVLPVVIEPETEDLTEMPQPTSSPDIAVQSVRFRQTSSGAVLIEGNLKNTSSTTVALPEKVYALAYGEDGALLFEKEIYLPAGFLSPDMEQAFFSTYPSVEKGVQWVEVVLKK